MQITEEYIGASGVKYIFEYHDADSFDDLPYGECRQVRAACFCGDKLVIGSHQGEWGLIGGTIEAGETFEQTLAREIQEESNMKVLTSKPIGYQKMTDTRDGSHVYQLRYLCTAEPYGPFVSDPADSIIEIKLIDPNVYRQYFDWGEIGERIISRAVLLRSESNPIEAVSKL